MSKEDMITMIYSVSGRVINEYQKERVESAKDGLYMDAHNIGQNIKGINKLLAELLEEIAKGG